jgi:DNA-binding NarL/FixJ family response regulator
MPTYTVLLVRSENLAWEGLRHALETMKDVRVVGDVHDADQALELVAQVQPDLVVTGMGNIDDLPTAMLLQQL